MAIAETNGSQARIHEIEGGGASSTALTNRQGTVQVKYDVSERIAEEMRNVPGNCFVGDHTLFSLVAVCTYRLPCARVVRSSLWKN